MSTQIDFTAMSTAAFAVPRVVSPPGRVGPGSAGISLTLEEFDTIDDYDDAWRYELIHGVLVVNPIPSEAEGDPNDYLGYLLRMFQETHPNGKSLDLTLFERYVYLRNSRRRADRVIWAGLGRRPNPKLDVPTIVVEFVSEGMRSWRRDYLDKRVEYLEVGVQEYWIIDRFERKLFVFRVGDDPNSVTAISEQGIYTTALLPGFELPLAKLLAKADAWSQPGGENPGEKP
jgi:Uma2 family endonuclease